MASTQFELVPQINGDLVIRLEDGTSWRLPSTITNKPGADGKAGPRGASGADGKPGRDGANGADGVGVLSVMTTPQGRLQVTMTNGSVRDAGPVFGPKGEPGAKGEPGIAGAAGAKGADGALGLQGAPGMAGAKGDTGAVGPAGADASGTTAFALAQASRTLADRFGETANLAEYFQAGDTNWNGAMTRAIASGKPIEIPYRSTPYEFSQTFSLPAGLTVQGKGGRPILKPVSGSSTLFAISTSNVTLKDLTIDGSTAGLAFTNAVIFTGAVDCLAQRVRLQGNRRGFRIEAGSRRVVLDRWEARDIGQHSVEIDGAATHGNTVQNGSTENGGGFGVYLGSSTYQNSILNNRSTTTTGASLELVGVTSGCYENKIIGNHAEGLNDTGISVTGYLNTIIGNTVLNCQGNGIHIYGERNTVSGNTLRNNSQGYAGNALWRAGIAIQAGFGGTGQYNVITGNVCDDDQATRTQQYGIWIGPHSYETWSSKTWAAERYVTYGGNIYQTTLGGTSGATPPTHTTGTVSDGGVQWTFNRTPLLGLTPQKNQIVGNSVVRSALKDFEDTGAGKDNERVGGFAPAISTDPLTTSSIVNNGAVVAISSPGGGTGTGTGYNWPSASLNGALPQIAISAPTGSGSTATAVVTCLQMLGFGTASPKGTGYAVGDILTIQGGTPVINASNLTTGSPRQVRVATIDSNGGILTLDSTGTGGTYVYTAPWLDGTDLTGGTGTGAKLTASAWRVAVAPTIVSSGSGYSAAPTITYSPAFGGSAATTVTLGGRLNIASGSGNLLLDDSGTTLGKAGAELKLVGSTLTFNGVAVGGGAVSSVAGRTGAVILTSTDVGLGNVNNTTDAAKPISTATQTILNQKLNINNPTFTGSLSGNGIVTINNGLNPSFVSTLANGDTYDVILRATTDTNANGLTLLQNSSTRTDDGGVNAANIRNGAGPLILGTASQPTNLLGNALTYNGSTVWTAANLTPTNGTVTTLTSANTAITVSNATTTPEVTFVPGCCCPRMIGQDQTDCRDAMNSRGER